MKEYDLIKSWEQLNHVPAGQKIEKKMITKILKPRISKAFRGYYMNLVIYLVVLATCIVLLSMNIIGYRENPVMLKAESVLLGLSLIFTGYGVYLLVRIREINNFTNDLGKLLRSKIKFHRFHYEIWLAITALSAWILTFALNTLVDNQDGAYPIHRAGLFVTISILVIAFIYGIQKITAEISLRSLQDYLADLEDSYLDRTASREKRHRKMLWVYIAIFIILSITLVLGIIKSTSMA